MSVYVYICGMKISNFIYTVIGIAALLMAAGTFLSSRYHFPALVIAILLSLGSTILAYILSYNGLDQKRTQGFITYLMAGMFSKMMIGIISVLIVALEFQFMLKEYVFSFFISYFIFTGFEVYGLMRKLRA